MDSLIQTLEFINFSREDGWAIHENIACQNEFWRLVEIVDVRRNII